VERGGDPFGGERKKPISAFYLQEEKIKRRMLPGYAAHQRGGADLNRSKRKRELFYGGERGQILRKRKGGQFAFEDE